MAKVDKTENNVVEKVPIKATIIDYDHGVRIFENVRAVRIRNKEYSLLILEDYTPTLGAIDGTIAFLTDDDEILYNDVKGFYKHQDNQFTALLQVDIPVNWIDVKNH